MSNVVLVILTIISLTIPLGISWYIFYKIAERRHLMGRLWWIYLIILIICILITVGLSLTIPTDIMIIVSALFWGTGAGTIGGLMNYKLRYMSMKTKEVKKNAEAISERNS